MPVILASGTLVIEVAAPGPRLPDAERDVREVADPLPVVMGPLRKDGSRPFKARKDVVGKAVRVEGIAWGQPFRPKGQEGTVSTHPGPHVVYGGGSVFVRGVDFTETKARGKPVQVFQHYPVSKGCTSPSAPGWINALVSRKGRPRS